MTSSNGLWRSVLFVPAASARAVEKSKTLQADALIFDLEDAVGPDEKDKALGHICAALEGGGFQTPTLAVRINIETLSDITLALNRFIEAKQIRALVLPKIKSAADIVALAERLPAGTPLWAMIETVSAVVNLKEIAALKAQWPLEALILGPNDLRSELRAGRSAERAELIYAMGSLIMHARAHGLMALDGVYNAYQDQPGFEAECHQGKLLGFDGKTLIHPSQIGACETIFGPSAAERDWARAVVAAFAKPENADHGVISLDGEMIERLHLKRAEALLGIA